MVGILIYIHIFVDMAGVGAKRALSGAEQGALTRLPRRGAAQQGAGAGAQARGQEARVRGLRGAGQGGGAGPPTHDRHTAGAG